MISAAEAITNAGTTQLVIAAVLGIAAVIVLIAWAKWHPFLALILGSGGAGPGGRRLAGGDHHLVHHRAGQHGRQRRPADRARLDDRRAARRLGRRRPHRPPDRRPRVRLGAAVGDGRRRGAVGLPLFFEVGVVLLVPIVLLVARRTDIGLLRIGIPALAGLSVLHGLVPPHPGPLVAIASLNADLGLTLLLGLICAIPTVIIAGPVFGNWIAKRVPLEAPTLRWSRRGIRRAQAGGGRTRHRWRPGEPRTTATAAETRPRGPARPGLLAGRAHRPAAGRAHAGPRHRRADPRRGQQPARRARRAGQSAGRAAGRRAPGDVHARSPGRVRTAGRRPR